ncbi:2-amino-4-hydroxy-6-hydroxymethyldihydropteridine diphosphokinase [Rhizobium helianthi]|uniref:2-amino-4-hydroxy-6-hydroxymethyldihydropteridine pyrophosphokinase n=1 Tax=Rhizobium helianthi TaxID=1132695 RepID=A0ABW4LY42_9HYPH
MLRCVLNTVRDPQPVLAAIGLGGNLGDPVKAMAEALQALDRQENCRVLSVSRLYRTPPWGKLDQADFVNSCALVETSLSPSELLALCLSIERSMKRVRLERWGPRTIDIDVLTYGDEVIDDDGLQVPHPRMTERAFVLMPLNEIAPNLAVCGKKVSSWAAEADSEGISVHSEDRSWWRC